MTNQQEDPSVNFPEDELQILAPDEVPEEKEPISFAQVWNKILKLGLGESALKVGTALASLVLIALVIWVMSRFFLNAPKSNPVASSTPEETSLTPGLPAAEINPILASSFGIARLVVPHTNLPPKQRSEIIEYTIEQGDTLFDIAERFGLKPTTLLWSNRYSLGGNVDNLIPGIKLFVPPIDGAIYMWSEGDGLNGVAKFYNVTPDAIVDWPANKLNRETLGDYSFPKIPIGTMLFVPNGYGEFTDWLEHYTREKPAVSSVPGRTCGAITEGYIGNNTFVWPTTETWISGYDYSPETNHRAIDIAGAIGNPIYATDAGVVVYSGTNTSGYGNLVVIDHGTGWQSVYAHMDRIDVYCGDNVDQGGPIGTLGTSGNSTGPHLHFELRHEQNGIVNPLDFLLQ
jgi:murein DD-endopeptidase MepM/ murein hydrolase activator NlpD